MSRKINPLTGLPMTDIDMLQFRNTNTVGAGHQALLDSSGQMTKQTPNTGGLAETGANKSWTDTIASLFKPQGTAGTSTGGNILGAIGSGVDAASGLAGMYFAKKNYDLQKDQQDYLKNREAQSDARKSKFAANAGNGATY
jgi:hypothetical protein